MKTLKRLGASMLALGLVGAGAVAAAPAASAHANTVTGTAVCVEDGTYTVTWTIANDFNRRETVNHVGHTPDVAVVTPMSVDVARLGSGTMTSTGIPGTAELATLTVAGTWTDGFTEGPKTGTVKLDGKCETPKTPPSGTFTVECTADGAQADVGALSEGSATGGKFRLNSAGFSEVVTSGQQNVAVPPEQAIWLVYVPAQGHNQELDRHKSPKACPPPVVTKPDGSFVQECTDTGAEVTVGDLDSGTFENVVWTLTYGDQSKTVVSGEKVAVPGEVQLDLSYAVGGASKSVQSERSAKACPPPVVTEPDGSFVQKCTDAGAEVTIGDLDSGTFENVVWTLTYGDQSKTVVSGEKVAVPGEVQLDLSYAVGGASKSVQSERSAKACPPPVITPPSGTFTTECTATGAQADVGPLNQGSATGGSFRLVAPGFSQAVTSGQQDVAVPVSATITLEYVPAQGAAKVLDTKSSPAACPPPTVAPVRGLGVVKAVTPTAAVEFGDTLTYTLTVSATGTAPQTAVTVTDSVPSGTTYTNGSASCDLTCTTGFSGGVVTWGLGGMAAGSTRSVSFQVTVDTPEADADGGLPAVTILNAGAVQSAEVSSTPSNEVETAVTAVLGTKTGTDDDDADDDTSGDDTEVLAATGAGVPAGGLVTVGGLLILAGVALVAGSSGRLTRNSQA